MLTKKMLFAKPKQHTKGTPGSVKWYLKSAEQALNKHRAAVKAGFAALLERQFNTATSWQQDC